jgi:methylenetetrahydrofolate dehydrogenase (NADP+) / methenyltetrahydrofolate cyclohydrolase
MSPAIFNGVILAEKLENNLKSKVANHLNQGKVRPHIGAILFTEDEGSVLYSGVKQQAASRVGIEYSLHQMSVTDSISRIVEKIHDLNLDKNVTGIIIQKPRRKSWVQANRVGIPSGEMQSSSHQSKVNSNGHENNQKELKKAFDAWWSLLVSSIDPFKDVDGLHPETFQAIMDGTWESRNKALPATVKAVLRILGEALLTSDLSDSELMGSGLPNPKLMGSDQVGKVSVDFIKKLTAQLSSLKSKNIVILGKSDLLGKPLHALFSQSSLWPKTINKPKVSLWGKAELQRARLQGVSLKNAGVVVSATGVESLILASDLSPNSILIDVGEPKADFATSGKDSVLPKADFISPVPGGVGPLTVVSLLENALDLKMS